jgi:glycogen(starch) synthase
MRVLHVLHHSVPYLDGYCIRSKQIVDFQRSIGIDIEVVTLPQHELEVQRAPDQWVASETIDGVVYHRTALPSGGVSRLLCRDPVGRRVLFMSALRRSIAKLLSSGRFDVVHAHSPVLCGRPALAAASAAGVPLVYEVRGFWEDGFIARWLGGERSIPYRLSRHLETRVFHGASAVVAISRHMLDDIEARGIIRDKLLRVPNGVDRQAFQPIEPDTSLRQQLGLTGASVVGFIGSFYEFEGLECLLNAMVELRTRVPNVRLVLVGGGEQENLLPQLVRALGLQDHVIITGRVPHKDVARYYSVMDVLVYPRLRNRTTTLTTPLKPLEAMAMRKAVVGSDVGGLRELLDGGRVGLLFEAGNSRELADKLATVLSDAGLRAQLADAGGEYVLGERSWDRLVLKYQQLYESLGATRSQGKGA